MTTDEIVNVFRIYLASSNLVKSDVLGKLDLKEINRLADTLLIDKRKFEQDESNRRWEASLDTQPQWTWGK